MSKTECSTRSLTHAQKKFVAANQHFKCNNKPGVILAGLGNYECPLWKGGDHKGTFDISGYDIDHVVEWSISKDDSLDNLQALCISCHKVKTKKFMMSKKAKGKTRAKPDPEVSSEDEEDGVNNFRCNQCDKKFSSIGNLNRHIKSAKSCSDDKSCDMFKCEFCKKNFTQKTSLQKHHTSCSKKKSIGESIKHKASKKKYKERISHLEIKCKDKSLTIKNQATDIDKLTEELKELKEKLSEKEGAIIGLKLAFSEKND